MSWGQMTRILLAARGGDVDVASISRLAAGPSVQRSRRGASPAAVASHAALSPDLLGIQSLSRPGQGRF